MGFPRVAGSLVASAANEEKMNRPRLQNRLVAAARLSTWRFCTHLQRVGRARLPDVSSPPLIEGVRAIVAAGIEALLETSAVVDRGEGPVAERDQNGDSYDGG